MTLHVVSFFVGILKGSTITTYTSIKTAIGQALLRISGDIMKPVEALAHQ